MKACIKRSDDDAAFIARPWATSAELRASHRLPATLASQERTFTRHDQAKKPFDNHRGPLTANTWVRMMTKGLGNQGTTP